MRAFFAPSSAEQPAEASVSIAEVKRWLISRGELPSSPALERLRAAVVVLTTKPKPRQEDVEPLCASWNVRQKEHKKKRPLATLITELQQAVLAEFSELRGSLGVQPGASASSAVQPAGPPLVSEAASNSEQLAVTRTAAQSRVKRAVEIASAAQPGRHAKARRQEGASSALASATIPEALHLKDDDPGVARLSSLSRKRKPVLLRLAARPSSVA